MKVGDIYIRVLDEKFDRNNKVGDLVEVVEIDKENDIILWNYIPRVNTICTPNGYDNGVGSEHFLRLYTPHETTLMKKILEAYGM